MKAFADISQMDATGREAEIQNRQGQELALRYPASALVDHVWVDPHRDFALLRYETTDNGKLMFQVSIGYQRDPQGEWVPSGWDIVTQNLDGGLQMSTQSKVVEYALNPAVPADRFDITFPPGTDMRDFAKGRDYIVTDRGERPITPKERGHLSYEQIVSSDRGSL
jgi:hypothetical protein